MTAPGSRTGGLGTGAVALRVLCIGATDFLWHVREHRDGDVETTTIFGLKVRVQDCDGDLADWSVKDGDRVLAEGQVDCVGPIDFMDEAKAQACRAAIAFAVVDAVNSIPAAEKAATSPICGRHFDGHDCAAPDCDCTPRPAPPDQTGVLGELSAALKPFAEAAADLDEEKDTHDLWEHHTAMNLTAGDLRRARKVYLAARGLSEHKRAAIARWDAIERCARDLVMAADNEAATPSVHFRDRLKHYADELTAALNEPDPPSAWMRPGIQPTSDPEARDLFQSERISAAQVVYDAVMEGFDPTEPEAEVQAFDAMKAAIAAADGFGGRDDQR